MQFYIKCGIIENVTIVDSPKYQIDWRCHMSKPNEENYAERISSCKSVVVKLFLRPEGFNGKVFINEGNYAVVGHGNKFSYRISRYEEGAATYFPKKKFFKIKYRSYRPTDINKKFIVNLDDGDCCLSLTLYPELYIHRKYIADQQSMRKRKRRNGKFVHKDGGK